MTRDDRSRQPPLAFEDRYHLSGIAGNYIFPAHADRASMQARLDKLNSFPGTPPYNDLLLERMAQYAAQIGRKSLTYSNLTMNPQLAQRFDDWTAKQRCDEIAEMYTQLVELNPTQLGLFTTLHPDQSAQYDIVAGVVSDFNPDDICYYLSRDFQNASKDKDRRQMEANILKRLGSQECTVGWIASTSTLERIAEQMRGRCRIPVTHSVDAGSTHPAAKR